MNWWTGCRHIYVGLDDFKDLCGQDQLSLARMALKRGATGKAVALLKRAQSLGNQQVAEASGSELAVARNKKLAASAAFLLGQLAETDFNYFAATQLLPTGRRLAALQPDVFEGRGGTLVCLRGVSRNRASAGAGVKNPGKIAGAGTPGPGANSEQPRRPAPYPGPAGRGRGLLPVGPGDL